MRPWQTPNSPLGENLIAIDHRGYYDGRGLDKDFNPSTTAFCSRDDGDGSIVSMQLSFVPKTNEKA